MPPPTRGARPTRSRRRWSRVFGSRVTVLAFARRYVERRVAVEEPERHQHEPGVLDRHHGPVFRTHEVRDSERIPNHEISVDDRPIVCGPARQAAVTALLVRVLAARDPFARLSLRLPHMLPHELHSPSP